MGCCDCSADKEIYHFMCKKEMYSILITIFDTTLTQIVWINERFDRNSEHRIEVKDYQWMMLDKILQKFNQVSSEGLK